MTFLMCNSQEVPYALTTIAPQLNDEQLREALLDNWTRCEAHGPYREQLLTAFKRVGFITDTDHVSMADIVPDVAFCIYRGNLGEPEPCGLSWTLRPERAQFFCKYYTSIRAHMILGIPPLEPGQHAMVWRAQVRPEDVLGFFDGRGEEEVVVDPSTLFDVTPIQELRDVT